MSKRKIRKKSIQLREKLFTKIDLKYSYIKKIIDNSNLKKKLKIGGYYPINFEIDCLDILKKFERDEYKISLPIIKKNNQMDFFECSTNNLFYLSKYGIPEPFQSKKIYPDVILVPMVAFDKEKYRIGYGGGYYDRYIEKIQKIKKVLTIGLAFSFQKIKKIPSNKYDKKLDLILTEKYILQ